MTNPEVKLELLQTYMQNFNEKFSFEQISFNKVTSFKTMVARSERRDRIERVNKQSLFANFALGHMAINSTHADLTSKILTETQNCIA